MYVSHIFSFKAEKSTNGIPFLTEISDKIQNAFVKIKFNLGVTSLGTKNLENKSRDFWSSRNSNEVSKFLLEINNYISEITIY